MDRKRAACYIRTSTDLEAQEDSYSLQREYYTSLINADRSLVFAGCYGDPGKSGRSLRKRDGFARMLGDCRDHKIDLIYTKSVSRFARNITDLAEAVNELRALGVYVYFEREGICTDDRSSELLLNILGIIAQEESRSLGENVRMGLRARMAEGHAAGRVPYGYRRVGASGAAGCCGGSAGAGSCGDGACSDASADERSEYACDTEWMVYEPEAERIRLAFEMAAGGCRYPEIRMELDGIEAASGSLVRWSSDRLRRTLRNVAYKGDVLAGRYCRVRGKMRLNRGELPLYYIEEHHEPIVAPETFDLVQAYMDSGVLKASRRTV